MIEIHNEKSDLGSMNPIAFIEATAAARSAALGALATDPIDPDRTAAMREEPVASRLLRLVRGERAT
jgi:hypothetical protein